MNVIRICHHPKYGSFYTAFFYRQWRLPTFPRSSCGEVVVIPPGRVSRCSVRLSLGGARMGESVPLSSNKASPVMCCQPLVTCYGFDTSQENRWQLDRTAAATSDSCGDRSASHRQAPTSVPAPRVGVPNPPPTMMTLSRLLSLVQIAFLAPGQWSSCRYSDDEVTQRWISEPLRISPVPKAIRDSRNRRDSAKKCPQLSSTPVLCPPGRGTPTLPSTH